METIIIFGASDNQRTLIQTARLLGYRTIAIDPEFKALARTEADIFEVVGAKDKEATIAIAKKFNARGIVTSQMENPLLLMAEVAEEMGYIFPTKVSIQKARNKWLMKQSFYEHQVPCSRGVLIKNGVENDLKALNNLTFPLIIKPLDSFSSRGVYKVNSIEEIKFYIDKTRHFSSNGDIILEEFLDGAEVSVESVTQNGITEIVQITDKVITPFPTAVEMAHIQPCNHALEVQEEIKSIVKKAVQAIGLDNCGTHTEVKITSNGLKIVEIGARLGGDYITSHLVPLSTGVNIEAAAIQIAMGSKPDIQHKFSKGAVIQYLDLPPGTKVAEIGEWKSIFNDKKVKHAMIIAEPGIVIPAISDSAKRMGFVIVQHANRQKAIELAQENISRLQNYINFI